MTNGRPAPVMAQKATVALEDDLIGGPADESVWFAVKGATMRLT
jgi:hypothetical protein